jgi:lipoteichoic acid synthase
MVNLVSQSEKLNSAKRSPIVVEIILWILFAAALVIKCAHFQFSTKLNIKPYFSVFNTNMLIATLTSIMVILAITIAVFNKKRLLALFIIDLFLTTVIFADTIYYRYYYNAITIPVLYQIGLVGSLKDSIRSLLKAGDLIYIADIPLFIAGLFLIRKITHVGIAKLFIVKRLILAVIILSVSFGLFQWSYSKSSSGVFTYDNNYVVNSLGVLYFHYYDVKRFIKDNFFTDRTLTASEKSEIDTYYSSRIPSGDKYKGVAKGKNLIVVQIEAMQQFLINKKLGGKEITPNLNKFIKDSAYFDNYFYQIGPGNTADAEFLTNTSLYPLKEGAVYFVYPSNTYESTANTLKTQGYNTYALHANNPSFWNRTEMYKSMGFDKFINSNDFTLDEQLGWGLGDKSFFRQALSKIDTSKPFYGFFITLASHYPFNYFDNYPGFDAGKYDKTFLGDYIKAANYADQAIGSLFEELKSKGLYDNSVIVIYGDHYAVTEDHADQLQNFLGIINNPYNWAMLQKTPCFIHYPGMVNTGINHTICGEIDILPTIANLMDLKVPYALGKDIFNTDKGYAVLRSGSVITDDFTYLTSTGQVYDKKGNIIKNNVYNDIIKRYQHQLEVSDIILTKNALKQEMKK